MIIYCRSSDPIRSLRYRNTEHSGILRLIEISTPVSFASSQPEHAAPGADRIESTLITGVCLVIFTYVFLANAWIGDDAYITFRVVDNFINGYGLTFNPDERVQAYTHPLWMLLLSAAYAVTSNLFYTTLALSYALCVLALRGGLQISEQPLAKRAVPWRAAELEGIRRLHLVRSRISAELLSALRVLLPISGRDAKRRERLRTRL